MNQTILRCFFMSNVWFVENMYTLFNFPKNWIFPKSSILMYYTSEVLYIYT